MKKQTYISLGIIVFILGIFHGLPLFPSIEYNNIAILTKFEGLFVVYAMLLGVYSVTRVPHPITFAVFVATLWTMLEIFRTFTELTETAIPLATLVAIFATFATAFVTKGLNFTWKKCAIFCFYAVVPTGIGGSMYLYLTEVQLASYIMAGLSLAITYLLGTYLLLAEGEQTKIPVQG